MGSLAWQPVFAGSILISIGANALVFGAITKTYGVDRGILKEDAWTRFYRRFFSLERVLAFGGIVLFAGLVLNLGLFAVWATGAKLPLGLELASLAQSLMIVGANTGMAGFLAMAIADRR